MGKRLPPRRHLVARLPKASGELLADVPEGEARAIVEENARLVFSL